jgi:AcrR family transcriptional regulator
MTTTRTSNPPSLATTAGTAERITAAAIELFSTKGFAGTGIRELAERVGISTASLYHHIGSKDDLLDLIVGTAMKSLIEMGSFWVNHDGVVSVRMAGLVASHVTIHALAPQEAIVTDRQLGAMQPASRQRAIRDRDRYERLWRVLVQEGVETGVFHVDDAKLATLALLGATSAVADWYKPKGALTVETLAGRYVNLSFQLLGARSAPKLPDIRPALHSFHYRWDAQL